MAEGGGSAAAEGFDLGAALERLRPYRRVLVCAHDDPDPDALAAAWGLQRLLEDQLGAQVTVGFDGIIGRAENRAMVRELGYRLRRVSQLDPRDFDGALLVDTQPAAENHSLPAGLVRLGCVDHHPHLPDDTSGYPWYHVCPTGGATATLVLGYLRRAGVPVAPKLATAFLYGLRTDTQDFVREAGAADLEALAWLHPLADHAALGAIINPLLEPGYFVRLHHALAQVHVHGRAVVAYLGPMPYPDLVAEMADLLVRRQATDWCLAGGIYGDVLRFSLRTRLAGAEAGSLARALTRTLGGAAGGHGMTAGGRIPLPNAPGPDAWQALWRWLRGSFLTATGQPPAGASLVGGAPPE